MSRTLLLCSLLAVTGCNAVLENDSRTFDPDTEAEDGASGAGGDQAGEDAGDGADTDEAGRLEDADELGDRTPGGDAAERAEGGARAEAGEAGRAQDASRDAANNNDARPRADASAGDAASLADASHDRDDSARLDASDGEAAPPTGCALPTPVCAAGTQQSEEVACGSCGTGTAVRTRTCLANCTWGAYSPLSACQSTEQCVRGMSQTRSVACACGGTKSQSRTCTTACAWGAWTDTSSCDLACCTEVVYCNTPVLAGVPASRGTWCRQQNAACTRAEVLSDCTASVASVSCVIVPELFVEYL